MCFKSYYEKRPNQRKGKVPKTINNQEIKVPSKPKKDKPKDRPEVNPMEFIKIPINASQVEDKDKDVQAKDNASKAIKTAKKSTLVSEKSRNTRIPKNKSDTYETLEELIDDIDDNTLNKAFLLSCGISVTAGGYGLNGSQGRFSTLFWFSHWNQFEIGAHN